MTIREYLAASTPAQLAADYEAFCLERGYNPRDDVREAIMALHDDPDLLGRMEASHGRH